MKKEKKNVIDAINSDTGEDLNSLRARISELEKELSDVRKQAEVLRRAEIAGRSGSWELHLDTLRMYGSEGARLIYGVDDEIMDYENLKRIPLPEYRPVLDRALKELIEEGKPYNVEFRIRNRHGELIDIHSICEYDSSNRILFGTIRDITEVKKAEAASRKSNSDLSELLRITIELLELVERRQVLQRIIEGALKLIDLDTGAIYMIDDGRLSLESTIPPLGDSYPEEFRHAELKNHPHIRKAVSTKAPLIVHDISEETLTEEERLIIGNRNMHSLIYIPFHVLQKTTGVLILGSLDRFVSFNEREINLGRTFSNIASLALENTLLFEKLNNYIGELKDAIVERDRSEGRLRLLDRAVEQSPVSIVITDPEGRIEYVNPKFTEITGYSSTEAIGKTPGILKSGYHPLSFYEDLWGTIKSGKDWFGEIKNKKKSGDYYWESVVISPMTDEHGITHFIGVKEDVTEKKVMLGKLIAAKEKAEESDRLKTAFLHNISHEIRTPLNAIVGFSGFLDDPDLTPEKRRTYIDIIHQSNSQLLSIIDGIIRISHLEAGQVELNNSFVDINRVMENLHRQFLPVAVSNGLEFTLNRSIDAELKSVTDEGKLIQIVSNLLDNAFKFTTKGHVELGYRLAGGFYEIFVEDTGIGIPEEEHLKIFERFYQANKSNARFYPGTGLGLSISAGYAELLGGSLNLKSKPGEGSVFTLILPYRR